MDGIKMCTWVMMRALRGEDKLSCELTLLSFNLVLVFSGF